MRTVTGGETPWSHATSARRAMLPQAGVRICTPATTARFTSVARMVGINATMRANGRRCRRIRKPSGNSTSSAIRVLWASSASANLRIAASHREFPEPRHRECRRRRRVRQLLRAAAGEDERRYYGAFEAGPNTFQYPVAVDRNEFFVSLCSAGQSQRWYRRAKVGARSVGTC